MMQAATLPDGSTTTALVPQVYLAPKAGDLANNGQLFAGGAVISANEVQLALSGDVNNSGTIAGRKLVDIKARNIDNSGLIQGDVALLSASQDINITGGLVRAHSGMSLAAGGDLNLITTTHSAQAQTGANSFARQGVDRVAGLYVSGPAGVLLASAGGDIQLTAAQLSNAGTGLIQLDAGGSVKLDTVQVGVSQDLNWSATNYLCQSSQAELGSSIQGAGAVDIWNVDLNEGWLRWSFEGGRVMQADVQVIGTYNTRDGSFLWGWDHPSVPAPLRQAAQGVRAWGEARAEQALTTRSVSATEQQAWEWTALAAQQYGASGAYRGRSDATWVYMVYGPVSEI